LKVLISAYACEPYKGSEPGVGWNWVLQIARFHEVWVVTRKNNRESIERATAQQPVPNAHFVYADLPPWTRFWKKGGRGARLYNYMWQIHAFFVARKLHQKITFDVGHHVTFVNDWSPSFLCLLPIPFIWGPVGGSNHRAPLRFWKEFGLRGMLYETVRASAIIVGRYLDPFVWLTRKRAGFIIAMSEGAVEGFPASMRKKILPIGNVGFSFDELPDYLRERNYASETIGSQVPVLFTSGRLVHWKGYSVLLKACAECRRRGVPFKLWIAGGGPEESRLRKLAVQLGISDCVDFLGYLPDRDAVFDRLARCDIFVMPTFHDGPPVIFLEAMAVGKPVICLDLGGASEIIKSEWGVKLSARSLPQVIHDLAQAIDSLGGDPDLRSKLGAAGRRTIANGFSWNSKGDAVTGLYQKLRYSR
jgi:glycosyltransferase involved in cell wall biosynthesis